MILKTTSLRVDNEQAAKIAATENEGLLGVLFNRLGHVPKTTTVLETTPFYYPYYVAGATLTFRRVAGLGSRDVVALAVMEGAFGSVQEMRGSPEMEDCSVPPEQVVACRYGEKQAQTRICDFLRKKGYTKYRSIPDIRLNEFFLVYKPHYACLCQKGKKTFYRVVDAELCERNYMLDIKFKTLAFVKATNNEKEGKK